MSFVKQGEIRNCLKPCSEELTNAGLCHCHNRITEVGNAAKPDVGRTLAPHRCPVCGGNGLVDNGFYTQTSGQWSTTSAAPEQCRSCNGTGVLWG